MTHTTLRRLLWIGAFFSTIMFTTLAASGCAREPEQVDLSSVVAQPIPEVTTQASDAAIAAMATTTMPGASEVAVIDQALAAADVANQPTSADWAARISRGVNGENPPIDRKYADPMFKAVAAGNMEAPYPSTESGWIPPNSGASSPSVTLYMNFNDDAIQAGLWAAQGALANGVADQLYSLPYSTITGDGYPAYPAKCELMEGYLDCVSLGRAPSEQGEWSESILDKMVLATVRNLDVLEGTLICGQMYCMDRAGTLVGRMSNQARALLDQPTQCMVRTQSGAHQCNVVLVEPSPAQ